jgi:6-phosphogluconolactonase
MPLEILENADAVAARAARLFADIAGEAVRERGRFTVALAGGRTPERAYVLLAGPEYARAVDWGATVVFWGDERFVPLDDERSNHAMARRSLIERVPIPPDHVHPVPTSLPSPDDTAMTYEQTFRHLFPTETPPRFDLFLLGLGDDGHTASLFPGKPSLTVTDRLFVASPPGILPPPVDRVTATFPLINAARNIIFLVTGASKAAPLKAVLEDGASVESHPAAGVRPVDGTVTWLVDREAAGMLDSRK